MNNKLVVFGAVALLAFAGLWSFVIADGIYPIEHHSPEDLSITNPDGDSYIVVYSLKPVSSCSALRTDSGDYVKVDGQLVPGYVQTLCNDPTEVAEECIKCRNEMGLSGDTYACQACKNVCETAAKYCNKDGWLDTYESTCERRVAKIC